jgi:hypothetical protein
MRTDGQIDVMALIVLFAFLRTRLRIVYNIAVEDLLLKIKVTFEVVLKLITSIGFFCGLTSCVLVEGYRRFRGICCVRVDISFTFCVRLVGSY